MLHTIDPTSAHRLSYLANGDTTAWENFVEQCRRVEPHMGALARWMDTLRRPRRSIAVDVPVRMDDGRIMHFEGFRVHHNTSRGPAKGGVRFHQDSTLSEVTALSGWMTIKTALVNVPFGGGKGAIRVDPLLLSTAELERMTRRYTAEIAMMIGPDRDIPAPDVNTNAQVMAWMMDTYSSIAGTMSTGVVTGKPVSIGGSLGRESATGQGVYIITRRMLERLGRPLEGARIAIQGFGNVGAASARFLAEAGARIVGVQEIDGTLYRDRGIDPFALTTHRNSGFRFAEFPGAEKLSREDFWDIPTDVLIPAALENQIDNDVAYRIRTGLVVEAANGPTLPTAEDILDDRGIHVVPDVLANAGGVVVSYFEWVQDIASLFWNEAEVHRRLAEVLESAFDATWAIHLEKKVNLRTAGYVLACRRVLEARELRGLYP